MQRFGKHACVAEKVHGVDGQGGSCELPQCGSAHELPGSQKGCSREQKTSARQPAATDPSERRSAVSSQRATYLPSHGRLTCRDWSRDAPSIACRVPAVHSMSRSCAHCGPRATSHALLVLVLVVLLAFPTTYAKGPAREAWAASQGSTLLAKQISTNPADTYFLDVSSVASARTRGSVPSSPPVIECSCRFMKGSAMPKAWLFQLVRDSAVPAMPPRTIDELATGFHAMLRDFGHA
jgi:hypothetical protein